MPLSQQKPRKTSKNRQEQANNRFAYILKPNGDVVEVWPRKGKTFSLEELQIIVGGYIEIVGLADGSAMVLNEKGKLDDLPLNAKATVLFNISRHAWYAPIMGTVLVCSRNCL